MNQNINSFVWHKIHMLAFDTETEEEKEGMMKIFNTIIQNNPTISDDLKFKHLNNDKEDKVQPLLSWKMHEMVNKRLYGNVDS